jgi:hypothetical protein
MHILYNPEASVSEVAMQDRNVFLQHPEIKSFVRDYIPGEFDGLTLPESMTTDQIAFVYVKWIDADRQARIAITKAFAQDNPDMVVRRHITSLLSDDRGNNNE